MGLFCRTDHCGQGMGRIRSISPEPGAENMGRIFYMQNDELFCEVKRKDLGFQIISKASIASIKATGSNMIGIIIGV
jgi:hypothetical protein